MRRGVVLPFTPQGFTHDDHTRLQRCAAACPATHIDILIGRNRHEIAVLILAGWQLWIRRDGPRLQAREASSGQLLATDTCMGRLLEAVQAILPPVGVGRSGATPKVSDRTQADLPYAGE